MSFERLKIACEELRAILCTSSGRELVRQLSIDEPKLPQDELHFKVLALWCYALVNEAGSATIKHIQSLLRASKPVAHKAVQEAFDLVHAFRTLYTHDLQGRRAENFRVKTDAWLHIHGGQERDWNACCSALAQQMEGAIRHLSQKWKELMSSPDKDLAVIELIDAVERKWEAHEFDLIVQATVERIGLSDLDVTKYRKQNLNAWRRVVDLFQSRAAAEEAVSAVILRDLQRFLADNGKEVPGPTDSPEDTSGAG